MRKILIFIFMLAISIGVAAQYRGADPVQTSLGRQIFLVTLPLLLSLGSLVAFAFIVRAIFNPWLERHIRALERIEKQMSHMSGIDTPISQIQEKQK